MLVLAYVEIASRLSNMILPLDRDELLHIIDLAKQNSAFLMLRETTSSYLSQLDEIEARLKSQTLTPNFLSTNDALQLKNNVTEIISALQEIPYYNQSYYIDRMKALGYAINESGMCRGIAEMSRQAFFADGMDSFVSRLKTIIDLPIISYQNDFASLRKNAAYLLQEGKEVEAAQIIESIIDIIAFFDGIALYFDPELYDYLLPEKDKKLARFQNSSVMSSIIQPIAFDDAAKAPEEIGHIIGGYEPFHFALMLSLLKEHLGECPFSLLIRSAQHAMHLSYNNGGWELVDPNQLPGQLYFDIDQLDTAVVTQFGLSNTFNVVIDATCYCHAQNAKVMSQNFVAMQHSPEWLELHEPSTFNVHDEKGYSSLFYAARYCDRTMISQAINGQIDLNQDISPGGGTILQNVCSYGTDDDLDLLLLLINQKVNLNHVNKIGRSALDHAHMQGNMAMVNLLIMHGAHPTEKYVRALMTTKPDLLNEWLLLSYHSHQYETVSYFMAQGVVPQTQMSLFFCQVGDLSVVQHLIADGIRATQQMLEIACTYGHASIVSFLLDSGIKPTSQMLKQTEDNGHVNIARLLKNELQTQNDQSVLLLEKFNDIKRQVTNLRENNLVDDPFDKPDQLGEHKNPGFDVK